MKIMSEDIKRKFHTFIMAMEEEARLYEQVQEVVLNTADKLEVAQIVYDRYAKSLEESMKKSKQAWEDWQNSMK